MQSGWIRTTKKSAPVPSDTYLTIPWSGETRSVPQSKKTDQLNKTTSGQYIDDSGRKLVANGYVHDIGDDDSNLVMHVWTGNGYDEEEVWTVKNDKLPPDSQAGSYMRLFEDGNGLELHAPVWTAEEMAEIKEKARELDVFFDLPDKP